MPSNAIARLLALGGELAPLAPGAPRRKFDLAHMRVLLQALGNPHRRFPSILIAGTNGKGSTAATLASILQQGGYSVGLYTSPHLEHPNERIRVNGVSISDERLASLFLQVENAASELVALLQLPYTPSFFETITAIGFLYFASPLSETQSQSPVDIAILEVGLGGRLDATNIVDPLLSILTDISLDHQEWLGSTIAAITHEKTGILRPGGTLITLPQHPEANQAIGEAAVPLHVHAISAADFLPPRMPQLPAGFRNSYQLSLPPNLLDGDALAIDSPLAGEHQQRNIALAITAAIELHRNHGFPLNRTSIEQGVRATSWPGRLQLLQPPAELAGASVLLDAAHNPSGAWALRAALSSLPVTGPRTLVFACMQDKAVDEIAEILFPVMDQVLLTRTGSPRTASLALLAEAAARTGTPTQLFLSAAEALSLAMASTPKNGLIVVAGSIMLLGECLPLLRNWHSEVSSAHP